MVGRPLVVEASIEAAQGGLKRVDRFRPAIGILPAAGR
jgi:hypothetical protein